MNAFSKIKSLIFILFISISSVFATDYSGEFHIGGTSASYYPVIFSVTGVHGVSSLGKLSICIPDVHKNGTFTGSFFSEFEFISSNWGHMPTKIVSFTYSIGNGPTYNDPIGDFADGSTEGGGSQLVIWLKGGASYNWSSSNNSIVTLVDGNSDGTVKTNASGVQLPIKTEQAALVYVSKNNRLQHSVGLVSTSKGLFGGDVGIGTFEPKTKLDVHGSINILGNLGMNTYDPTQCFNYDSKSIGHYSMGWYQESQCTNSGPSLLMSGFGGVKFFTNGQQRFAITNTGKIGIGFSNPDVSLSNASADEMLTVNGTIHAKEVRVDLTGSLADYVFSPTYNLRPLYEVEAFVKENNHLPEIPSAAEVKEKGLSMGEMQNKLLQKIEELTLYVIELQKTNEKQSARIEELEKKAK